MNNKLINKISKIVGIVGMVVSVILGVLFYISLSNDEATSANINLLMIWTLIMIIVVAIFAFLVGPIISLFSNPKSLKKAIITVGVLVGVFLISYLIADKSIDSINLNYKIENIEKQAFWTDLGLKMTYIFAGITILSLIFSEIKSLLKL